MIILSSIKRRPSMSVVTKMLIRILGAGLHSASLPTHNARSIPS